MWRYFWKCIEKHISHYFGRRIKKKNKNKTNTNTAVQFACKLLSLYFRPFWNFDLFIGREAGKLINLGFPQCKTNSKLQSWTKVLGHFCFSGAFSIHTGPTPPLTPRTMSDVCIQNFFRVSTLYRVGGGRTARKFRERRTLLRGNREMTERYEYCSTVPRTFVQDFR